VFAGALLLIVGSLAAPWGLAVILNEAGGRRRRPRGDHRRPHHLGLDPP